MLRELFLVWVNKLNKRKELFYIGTEKGERYIRGSCNFWRSVKRYFPEELI
jgi:hypothetical protein